MNGFPGPLLEAPVGDSLGINVKIVFLILFQDPGDHKPRNPACKRCNPRFGGCPGISQVEADKAEGQCNQIEE